MKKCAICGNALLTDEHEITKTYDICDLCIDHYPIIEVTYDKLSNQPDDSNEFHNEMIELIYKTRIFHKYTMIIK